MSPRDAIGEPGWGNSNQYDPAIDPLARVARKWVDAILYVFNPLQYFLYIAALLIDGEMFSTMGFWFSGRMIAPTAFLFLLSENKYLTYFRG